jgi:negative regulator of sigma E activity
MSPPERIDALVAGDPPEADEQRLARVIYELQAARPAAPEPLRGRIEALASAASPRRPSLLERLTLRRALLALAPAVVVVSVGAAVVQGIVSASSPTEEPQPLTQPNVSAQMPESRDAGAAGAADETDSNRRARSLAPVTQTAGPPNSAANRAFPRTSAGRAQDYYADLRLRVDDLDSLSDRMQEALRLTRRYGGYVVSTSYRNPRAGEGDATLELRVPIGRVQQALVAFSELGAILSQNVSIRDLQGQIDRYTRDIRRLRDRMAALRASLLDPNLTAVERTRMERQLAQARSRLGALEQERRALTRQGRFAKISLALTTQKPAAKEETPGRIERAVNDAGSVLAKEVAFGLYALIVASPFVLLIALAIVGARAGRRRADQRLLERA